VDKVGARENPETTSKSLAYNKLLKRTHSWTSFLGDLYLVYKFCMCSSFFIGAEWVIR